MQPDGCNLANSPGVGTAQSPGLRNPVEYQMPIQLSGQFLKLGQSHATAFPTIAPIHTIRKPTRTLRTMFSNPMLNCPS